MKNSILVIIFVAGLIVLNPGVEVWAQETHVGRLSHLEGKVFFQSGRSLEWVEGYVNSPVQEGDRIWMDVAARGELDLVNSVLVRMNSDTKLDVVRMGASGTIVKVWIGSIFVRITDDGNRENPKFVETPDGQVEFLSKGLFRIEATQENSTLIRAYEGVLETKSSTSSATLRKGELVQINQNGQLTSVTPIPQTDKDDFTIYNASRDERLVEPESNKHVHSSVTVGVYDLDYYGIWVHDPLYGYCWQPRSHAGWAPYRFGRWVWIRPWGWTWISYDPWGWAPYHYGYWYYSSQYGWMWKPDRYYGPHWVVWTAHTSSVGWVPMHPKDAAHVHWSANGHHWQADVSDPVNATLNPEIGASTFITREDFQQGKLIKSNEEIVKVEKSEISKWQPEPAQDIKPVRQAISKLPSGKVRDAEKTSPDRRLVPGQERRKVPTQRRDVQKQRPQSERPPQRTTSEKAETKKDETKKDTDQKKSDKEPDKDPEKKPEVKK
ncbi:DUF6600 domain-containing protein [candidate division CSSED10-310 bacterium]|uniref:DUF6600 domain-containing protein n=1 Tax=candidate division CSSED10-310 bacterium TaxID=2855610 RepID=A0ABV6YWX1_UNCC1